MYWCYIPFLAVDTPGTGQAHDVWVGHFPGCFGRKNIPLPIEVYVKGGRRQIRGGEFRVCQDFLEGPSSWVACPQPAWAGDPLLARQGGQAVGMSRVGQGACPGNGGSPRRPGSGHATCARESWRSRDFRRRGAQGPQGAGRGVSAAGTDRNVGQGRPGRRGRLFAPPGQSLMLSGISRGLRACGARPRVVAAQAPGPAAEEENRRLWFIRVTPKESLRIECDPSRTRAGLPGPFAQVLA